MHPESKLTNHEKQVSSGAQSHNPNVNLQEQQGPESDVGSKGTEPGKHGVKPNQISPGLKSVGGMMKTKSKRERSLSVDAREQKDSLAPVLESDQKGMPGTGHMHARTLKGPSLRKTATRFSNYQNLFCVLTSLT